jgi:paraquat-inducible protein B
MNLIQSLVIENNNVGDDIHPHIRAAALINDVTDKMAEVYKQRINTKVGNPNTVTGVSVNVPKHHGYGEDVSIASIEIKISKSIAREIRTWIKPLVLDHVEEDLRHIFGNDVNNIDADYTSRTGSRGIHEVDIYFRVKKPHPMIASGKANAIKQVAQTIKQYASLKHISLNDALQQLTQALNENALSISDEVSVTQLMERQVDNAYGISCMLNEYSTDPVFYNVDNDDWTDSPYNVMERLDQDLALDILQDLIEQGRAVSGDVVALD